MRKPSELRLGLDYLFYGDFGLATRKGGDGVAVKLQRLRAHVCGVALGGRRQYSLILYGPPGTGKTTLVEALAKSSEVPLVEITPSDILVGGEEAVERRTRLVFTALSMLTDAVILFDEFDPILQERDRDDEEIHIPQTVFEFLTPGMLPKLKRLHDAAERQRVAYVLATNFIYRLDEAAIREGRFDDKHGCYPPDVVSRIGRLLDQFQEWAGKLPGDANRVIRAIKRTTGGPIGPLSRRGWYTAPKKGTPVGDLKNSLFAYVEAGGDLEAVPREARYRADWKKRRPSGLEKQYWSDWELVEMWERNVKEVPGPTVTSWNDLVERWTGIGRGGTRV